MSAVITGHPCGLDPAGWQRVLDQYQDAFAEIDPAARLALVPRRYTHADGVARAVVVRTSPPVPMIEWARNDDAMVARAATFTGLDGLAADLLFVANDGAFEDVLSRIDRHPLGEMKRRIASGAIQVFVLRSRQHLRDLGYEDFLDLLGLPFLGACR